MKYLVLCFLFLAPNLTQSQILTVKDITTKKPLAFVTLFHQLSGENTATNINGEADITTFKGAESIEIRLLGYQPLFKSYDQLSALNFEVYMDYSMLNLEEVVVSASRWRQTTGNIPAKIISISPKDIALQNSQTAADLLGISGKIYIQKSQQGGGSPMIRGFATNRLLTTVDGVRMNNAIFRGGNIQNVISLDPYSIENTEVLFGPGSVIYGSDAIGGVMSFQTLTPQFSESDSPLIKGKVSGRFSSANSEKTGHADINLGFKKWSLISSISYWDFDHLRQGSDGPEDYIKPFYVRRENAEDLIILQDNPLLQIPSAYTQMNMLQKVRFQPNDKWDLTYGFHYSQTSPYGRYDRHNRLLNVQPRYAEWDYGPQKWRMNNLNITYTSDHLLFNQANLRVAQQFFEESRMERSLNRPDRTTQTERVDAFSANLDFVISLSPKHNIFYGSEYVLNKVGSDGFTTNIITEDTQGGPSRYPNAYWSSLAVYLNDEYKVSDEITLQAGLRYNQIILNANFTNNQEFYQLPFDYASYNNGALSGSLGGVWRISDTWVMNTNLGSAFRAPNVDDMGKIFDSEPGSVTVPNPELRSEYAYNADVGLAKVFGDFLKVDLTGYYTILQNAMVRRDFLLNGMDSIFFDGQLSKVQTIQNAAKANVYGLQAGIDIKIPFGLSFSSDLNIQVGKEETDDGQISPSRHAPPIFGTSRLNFKREQVQVQLNVHYQGERSHENMPFEEKEKDEIYAKDENGNNYAPAWYTINLKASYILSKKITINAGIENITDQRYRPYSSGISAPGRNIVASMTINF